MNIKVDWDNEAKTIMRYEFSKGWSWDDLKQIFDEGYILVGSVEHDVDVIMDFSNASMFVPAGAINQARRVSSNPRHENLGLTAVIGSNFASRIFHLISKMTGEASSKWEITFVNSLDEAYEAITTYHSNNEGTV